MRILQFYQCDNPEYWIKKIAESDWNAGKYLAELLETDKLKQLCGEFSDVLMLTDDDKLISFCTLAEKDEIPDTDMKPWIGFVYTFPQYRGKRYIGKLLNHACHIATESNYNALYISTDQKGLYENFGFTFTGIEKMSIYGNLSLIYKREI
ncbi:MAG: GNAT family N-acetyltransferase [Ruminococcus sp.]|nr:GNAT family N-acetyltransferase [Ruminococcus sp.]